MSANHTPPSAQQGMVTLRVPALELVLVLLGLRTRLEERELPSELQQAYTASYLALENAMLKASSGQPDAPTLTGAWLPVLAHAPTDRPDVFASFQESTQQLFERWLQSLPPSNQPGIPHPGVLW